MSIKHPLPYQSKDFGGKVTQELHLHPEANLEKQEFPFFLSLSGINLQHANMSGVSFREGVDFRGADLRGAVLDDVTFVKANGYKGSAWYRDAFGLEVSFANADLRGASLRRVDLRNIDFKGADLRGANMEGAMFPKDLIKFESQLAAPLELEQVKEILPELPYYEYEKVSFEQARDLLGISDNQFEFLVVSGGIKVRDNNSRQYVSSGFDPEKQHFDIWEIRSVKSSIDASKNPQS